MINPFDLAGPQFLGFYALFGCTVIAALYYARRIAESGTVPRIDYSNPYLLAYLRGGEEATVRVAAISLIDRGLLRADGEHLSAASKNAEQIVHRPVEKALLRRSRVVREIARTSESESLKAACKEYKDKLQELGLLPNEKIASARLNRLLIALVMLLGVAFLKIIVATARGRHNILFLILLAGVFSYIAIQIYNPVRTALGDAMLADLRTLFSSLKNRAATITPGGSTGEAALLMAVFGAMALPSSRFPIVDKFEKPKRGSTTSCGSSGCGSWLSSSCSGGSSCGGGSGCGGCGGGGD
jgi:uncharacterized protein (TIGR04222 family)